MTKIEKTFARKKKTNEDSNEKHQNQQPLTLIYALMSPKISNNNTPINKNKKKKKKDETREPKKDENPEKNNNKKKKDETLKIIIKRKKAEDSGEIKLKDLKKFKKEENSECSFPTSRVFRIIKSEASSQFKLSGEAVFLINKATEKFVELFTEDAYNAAVEDKKSFVAYKHLASVVGKEKRMDFLSDFVPEKVTAEKALAEIKPVETLPG